MLDLNGRIGVVSGAGDGIGRTLALELARRGADVAVLDIDAGAAEKVADEIAAMGTRSVGIGCDVSLASDVSHAVDAVGAGLGRPTIVWANAGVGAMGGLLAMAQSDCDWIYEVNVKGTLNILRAFAADLSARGNGGAIGITASVSGLTPLASYAAGYGATKHAVVGIGEALRAELEGSDIGVTILCPGLINTRIWDAARSRPERFGGEFRLPEAIGDRWRTQGMSAEWVAAEAIATLRAGGGYVSPVDPHSRQDYAVHAERIKASFRFPPD